MLGALANRFSRRAVLGLVALAVAVALMGLTVTNVGAAGQYVETTYFSNASHTVPVGVRIKTCNGHVLKFGSVSQFNETISFPCN